MHFTRERSAFLLCSLVFAGSIGALGCGVDESEQAKGEGGAGVARAALNAASCSSGAECASGHCVDGVCCDSACSGLCEACSVAVKGTGIDGLCEAISNETDPENECIMGCNGDGACIETGFLVANGNVCSANSDCLSGFCVDGVCCDSACSGTCFACVAWKKGGGTNGTCGPIANALDPDNECISGCSGAGSCEGYLVPAAQGTACTAGNQCASGFCADGVCCDSACGAFCKACNVPGQMGTCTESSPGSCAGHCGGDIGFPGPPNIHTNGGVAVGDLNGDGMDDLVDGTTTIYLARGHGFFQPANSYPMMPTGLRELADFDNDGDLDLIATKSTSLFVLKNIGNGAFSDKLVVSLPNSLGDLVVRDLNRDGFVDIAGSSTSTGNVLVYLNQGGTALGGPTIYSGYNANDIATDDMDNDGDVDLVIENGSSFRIMMNTGNGAFIAGTTTTTDWYGQYSYLATGDGDGDGDIDIFLTDQACCCVRMKANPGNGAYPAVTQDPRTCSPSYFFKSLSLSVADFNGDNRTDTLSPEYHETDVYLRLSGNSTQSYFVGNHVGGSEVGDFDGDGDVDALVGMEFGYKVMMNSGGAFQSTNPWLVNMGAPFAFAGADVDGDGDIDLIDTNSTGVNVRMGFGNGSFGSPVNYATSTAPDRIVARDINGDARPDLAVRHANSAIVSILRNLGNGTYAPKVDYSTGANAADVALEDVNGDNLLDLIVTAGSQVTIRLNQGFGMFGPAVSHSLGASSEVAVADINGDGLKDIIVAPAATNTNALGALINLGNGSFGIGNDIVIDGVPIGLASADFNADGKVDFVTNYTKGISMLINNGNSTFATTSWPNLTSVANIAAADINDDKLPDILGVDYLTWDLLFSKPYSNPFSVPFALVNSNNGTSFERQDLPVPPPTMACCSPPHTIITEDFNHNGVPDFSYAYGNHLVFHFSKCWQ